MASPVPSYASLQTEATSASHYSNHHSHSHSHPHSHYYSTSHLTDSSSTPSWPYSPTQSHRTSFSASTMTGSNRSSVPSLPSADSYSHSQHHYSQSSPHDSYLPSHGHSHYDRPTQPHMMQPAAARSSPAAYRHLPPTTATATATALPVSSSSSSAQYSVPSVTAPSLSLSNKPRAPRFIDTFQSRILSHPPPPASPTSTSSPSSPTGSPQPATASKPKRKRRTPTLDPYTKHIRSVKHNEAEVRRRQRLNGLLVELAECVGCRKPQKSAILRVTLEKVRAMERKIGALEDKVREAEQSKQAAADIECGGGGSMKKARTIKMAMETDSGLFESAYLPALSPLTGPTSSGSSSSSVSSMASSSSGCAWSASFDGLGGMSNSVAALSSSAVSGLADVSLPSPLPLSLFPPNLSLPNTSSAPMSATQSTNIDVYQSPLPLSAGCEPSDLVLATVHNMSVKQEPGTATALTTAAGSTAPLRAEQWNVLKAACVPMNVVDLSGRVLDCNAAFESFLGYELSTLRSSSFTFFEYTHPASLNSSFAQLSELIAHDDRPVRGEKLYISASGEVKKANTTLFMLRDGDGRHAHVVDAVCVLLEPVAHNGCIDMPPPAVHTA